LNKWRNQSRHILLALTLVLALSLLLAPVALAGVGNSVSHSHSSSYHGSYSGHSSGGGGMLTGYLLASMFRHPFILLIIIIVVFLIYKKYSSDMSGLEDWNPMEEGAATTYLGPLDLSSLKANDPDFSEDQFISWVNNIFLQLQEAWQEKDWKKVRPFESDELFNTHNKQLQEYIENGTTNVIDEVGILRTAIQAYRESGDKEILEVYLKCRMKDYIVKDDNKKVVEGDPDREITMEYLLTLARKMGVKTSVTEHTSVTRCPNCGASISINASGECEYCNSVVSNGDFDWVLTKLEVISQS